MPLNPYADNFESGGYFYNAIRQDITIVKGDTCSFAFQVQGLGDDTRPSDIVLTCKAKIEDENALFTCSLGAEIDLRSYDPASDVLTYVVRIPPSATGGLNLGRYFYDLVIYVNNDTLTLLKGRVTIDYPVRGVSAVPAYEDGDSIDYPLIGIPEGTRKVYTEQTISNIAEKINAIIGSSEGLTTAEMVTALEDIQDDITSLSTAINYMLNNEGGDPISLSDMITATLEIKRGLDSRKMEIIRADYTTL